MKQPPTYEQMYHWYVENNLTAEEIAQITGYSRSRIFYFLDRLSIPRNKREVVTIDPAAKKTPIQSRPFTLPPKQGRGHPAKIPGADWLYARYWEDNLGVTAIAKELNVNPNSVTKALHKYSIAIKPKYLCYEGTHTGRGDWSKSMRTRILKRDGFTCRLCGSQESLEVHHIIPLRLGGKTHIDNGISLCATCHTKIGFQEHRHIGQLLQLLHKTD